MSGESSHLGLTRVALVAVAACLTAIGVLFVHSTSTLPGLPFPSPLARRQLAKAIVGCILALALMRFDYRRISRLSWWIYGGLVLVLIGRLVVRVSSPAAGRVIDLRLFQVQPSELMKLGVVFALAHYLRYRADQRRATGLLGPYALTFLPMGLVAMQPDLGTSLMLPPVLLALLFVARARVRPLLLTLAVGLGALPVAFLLHDHFPLVRDYQMERLIGYVHQSEPLYRNSFNFQLQQALIAFGSGGLLGKGIGLGRLNQGGWVPVAQSDFIFPIIGEETGFVGAVTVVVLFATLVLLCFRVARHTREPWGRLVATGVGVLFAAQSLQNLGMTVGLTPITGLPLPFVSFGGSSLLSSWIAVGVVLSIAARRVRVVASPDLDPRDLPRAVRVAEDRESGDLRHRWPVE